MEMPVQTRSNGERSRPQRPPSPQQTRSRPGRPPPPVTVTEITELGSMQKCHDHAYQHIEQGLSADENRRPGEAKAFYDSGLREVNRALSVNCEQLQGTEEQKDAAKLIQQKLNKTKLQIQYRIQSLKELEQTVPSAPQLEQMETEAPPSYEMATSRAGSLTNEQFTSLGDSVMMDDTVDSNSLVANATEIFNIPDGVQIFFITPEGYVSAPSYPTALKVFKFKDQQVGASGSEHPPAFLQVGDWFYPLQPGGSPALHTNYGAYLFPDVTAATQGSSVGLMIPDTVSPAERCKFEDLMQSLTVMRQQEPSPAEDSATGETTEQPQGAQGQAESTSSKISKGLLVAADYLSWGVGKGAEKAGEMIKLGSTKIRSHLRPEENAKPIDPKLQKGIQYVRAGSHAAVMVSSYLVSKLGQATMVLAREAAPHIRKQGEKILPKSVMQKSGDGKSKMDGVIEVAASGLSGFGTVYTSLESAARALGRNMAMETSGIVAHKYGTDAGQLTEHTLFAAGNIAMTAHNANHFGVKAVAKRAAKDTGKAVLDDIAEKRKQGPPGGSGGAGGQGPSGSGQKS